MDIAALVERIRDGERFAPERGAVLDSLNRQRHARRRRRLAVRIGSVAAGVVIIALAATAIVASRPGATPARPPAGGTDGGASSSTAQVRPTPAGPPVTAADLAHYRWSTMPDAPIAARDQAAVGWTGTELIAWGGTAEDGTTELADGAAYDPATRTWRVLPASPLDARVPQASVWTGTEFVVWGGDHGQTDGAAYNPLTNSWRLLPPVPGQTAVGGQPDLGTGATAAWTGEVVQLLTWRYQGSVIQSWYYSPTRNDWTAGDPLRPGVGALIESAELLVRGSQVDAFVGWSYQDSTGGMFHRVSAFTRAAGDPRWQPVDYRPALDLLGPVVDAGSEILVAGGQPFVGLNSSPLMTVAGLRLNPVAGTSTRLPAFPAAIDQPPYDIAWTGAALLGFDTSGYVGDPDGTVQLPGATAAWDPSTNAWTVLESAPLAAYGTVPGIWTGTELLTWGLMFPPARANDPDRQVRAAGLVFGPADDRPIDRPVG